MLDASDAKVLKLALGVLKHQGNFVKAMGKDKEKEDAYVAGKADTAADILFDYLNCASNMASDENAGRAIA